MAAVVGQIQDDAYLIRENAEAQKAVMLDEILPKAQLTPGNRKRVEEAADALRQIFSRGEPATPKLPRGRVDKMLQKMASPQLSESIANARRRVVSIRDIDKRAKAQKKLDDRLSTLFSGMEARVAEGVKLTPLDEALARVTGGRVTKGMPGKVTKREELIAKAAEPGEVDVEVAIDELLEGMTEPEVKEEEEK